MSSEARPPGTGGVEDGPLREQLAQLKSQQERLFANLASGQQQFKHLARQVWRVQEDERRRLARELHDGLGQNLTALKHQIDALLEPLADVPELHARAVTALELCATTLEDTRALSRMLRPQVLDDLGLEAALTWLARSVGASAGFRSEVEAAGLPTLDSDVSTLLFRVAQEALTNAGKHAQASHVLLRAGVRGTQLTLLVADDGRGCEPTAALARNSEGMSSGLTGMRERVALFGGRFHFVSAPGEGTQLRVTLELNGASEPNRGSP